MQTETVVSPFAGLSTTPEVDERDAGSSEQSPPEPSPFEAMFEEVSPFGGESDDETDPEAEAAADFFESLRDEEFDDAVQQFLDEGAAQVLADEQQWTAPPSRSEAYEALEQWARPLTEAWDKTMDGFTAGLENTDVAGLTDEEFTDLLESLDAPTVFATEGFENLFTTLVRKAKGALRQAARFVRNPITGVTALAKSGVAAVRSGIQAVGKHVLGPLIDRLKSVGVTFLKGVVKALALPLTRILPPPLRPLVPVLVRRLGLGETGSSEDVGTAGEMAEALDAAITSLVFGSEDAPSEEDESAESRDPVAELDDARARLATALGEYSGGDAPIAEIEQFVPAALAIRPLLKLGLKVTGARDRLISLIAAPLATLIKKMVGADATRTIARIAGQEPSTMIARAVVGVGFTALGLESADDPHRAVAGEALASTVEATITEVLDELSDEALADPLQLAAAVQEAFATAAAAYLPDRVLRADLPERETEENGGFWILMPRGSGPRYRFRRYTRVLPVRISRRTARSLPWSDGGTLENFLLDRGVSTWPVEAEVDLYETLPGTVPGHFTRDDSVPATESPSSDEYQPLTEEVASALLREPGLGRRRGVAARTHRPVPGRRFYRLRVATGPGRRARRPRRLVGIRWEPGTGRLRILLRLTERRARALQAALQRSAPGGRRDLPGALNSLRAVAAPRLHERLTHRFARTWFSASPADAAPLARAVTAATFTALSAHLTQRGAHLAAAVADPADGVTIAVTFTGLTRTAGQHLRPTVTTHPGWRHA